MVSGNRSRRLERVCEIVVSQNSRAVTSQSLIDFIQLLKLASKEDLNEFEKLRSRAMDPRKISRVAVNPK